MHVRLHASYAEACIKIHRKELQPHFPWILSYFFSFLGLAVNEMDV